MKIKTLNGITHNEILKVFNLSFSDYFVPFHLSTEQFASKMVADNIELNVSVGVFENNILIAFILHGVEIINGKKVAYNGGTGVIPKKRGLGLTRQMYNFILPILKENGIDSLFLEVISINIQAIKSYEKSGYGKIRELVCYKGFLNPLEINNRIEIKSLNEYNWQLMESFWDISPTWQNSKHVVKKLKESNISLGAYFQNELVGYIIYNPNSKRLQQIAIAKKFRKNKVASTLINELQREFGNALSVINVEKNSKPITIFLERIGLEKYLEQVEMKLQLK